jgi:D-alanine-D-alanine ligase
MNDSNFQVAILFNEDTQIAKGNTQDLLAVQYTITVAQKLHEALTSQGYPVTRIAVRGNLEELEDILASFPPNRTFIFNNCDGFNGSNHDAVKVIRLIERMGFKHTGAPADSIEMCIDKPTAKEQLIRYGVPTPRYQVFERAAGAFNLEFPVIVKPSVEDASMGIDLASVVTNQESLFHRIEYIIEKYEQVAMVEQFIPGRELAVSMLGNESIEIMPIAEEDFSFVTNPLEQLLTYDSKWVVDSPYFQNIPARVPALLNRKEFQAVKKAAEGSFRAMGLHDFGRVDIRFNNGIPYVIDVNELPDLSTDSGFWNSARATGMTYPQLIERILTNAIKREGWIL